WKTAKSRFCKPICKPDGAGRLETSDTQRAKDHLTPPVHRGQPRDRRLRETTETNVVWLITQRRLASSARQHAATTKRNRRSEANQRRITRSTAPCNTR